MKTMTCKQLGGICDHEITANIPKEMIEQAIKHVEKCHPEFALKFSLKIKMYLEENGIINHDFLRIWSSIENNVKRF